MTDIIEKTLGEVEEDLKKSIPEPVSKANAEKLGKKRGVRKVAKKVKKVEKKGKKSNGGDDSNLISLADLAKEAKISTAACRRKLRAAEVDKGEGRWKWAPGSSGLKAARKALELS